MCVVRKMTNLPCSDDNNKSNDILILHGGLGYIYSCKIIITNNDNKLKKNDKSHGGRNVHSHFFEVYISSFIIEINIFSRRAET